MKEIRRAVLKRDGMRCHYCGRALHVHKNRYSGAPHSYATVDHIIPKSRGGEYETWNLVAACYACNQERGNMLYLVYLTHVRARRECHA